MGMILDEISKLSMEHVSVTSDGSILAPVVSIDNFTRSLTMSVSATAETDLSKKHFRNFGVTHFSQHNM